MPFLTIYQETRDNTIEAALREKDRTINILTNRIVDIEHDQKIIIDLLHEPEQLKKKLEFRLAQLYKSIKTVVA